MALCILSYTRGIIFMLQVIKKYKKNLYLKIDYYRQPPFYVFVFSHLSGGVLQKSFLPALYIHMEN